MKTELIEKGDLLSQLTILIEPEDYKSEFDKEIKKYSQKAHIKGFRRGKTPLTAIRKMYGKSVLADVINNKLQHTIESFIVDEKLDILGNPLPSLDQPMIDFDLKEMGPYKFQFDLGLAPTLAIAGAGKENTYDSYKVEVKDADVDDQLKDLQKRMGEQSEVSEPIQVLDIVTLRITEKVSEEKDAFSSDITIMPDRMTDTYQEEYIGKEIGYKSTLNIFELEKKTTEDYVRKYFLVDAPEETGPEFDTEVLGIKRLVPAQINEEFFIKAFGEDSEIKSEEATRNKIREDLEEYYNNQGVAITKRKILETLVDENDIDLPDEFLKRWLLMSNEKLTPSQIEEEYGDFVKNLKWTLIKKELNKSYKIDVTADQIKSALISKFKAQFAQYGYGMMGDMDFNSIGDKMMQNKEEVQKEYENLLAEGIMNRVLEDVTLKDKSVNTDEFKEIVDSLK